MRLACHHRRVANDYRTYRDRGESAVLATAEPVNTAHPVNGEPGLADRAVFSWWGTGSTDRPSDRFAGRPVGGLLRRAAAVLLVGALAAACVSCDGSNSADRPSGVGSASQLLSEQWHAFEDYLREQAATGAFSGAVLVAKDDRPIVEQAYGQANRETSQPNNTDTRFNIGSLGKMFTGVAIAQLVEQGKLGFDDPIGDYITGLSDNIAEISVDQLLTHTSGLGDFMRNGYPEDAKSAQTATDLLPLVVSQPLQYKPGTRERYSNSGYVVLGAIVEAITRQSYYDYVDERVFEPTGMSRTGWFPPGRDTDNTARSYTAAGDGIQRPPEPGDAPSTVTPPPHSSDDAPDDAAGGLTDNTDTVPWSNPSGGAYSTLGDLQRFAEALLDNQLLSPQMTATTMDGKVAMSSGDAEVAYGFTDGTINGVRIVGHGAGAPGVGAAIDIYPDLGYVVVVLTNYDGALDPVRDRTQQILTR
jgi:CubicO group peptidase (beta-lactamase class C family)